MAATEALARGVPVLGHAAAACPRPSATPRRRRARAARAPGDPAALAAALRRWFDEPALRTRLRTAASARAATLPGWSATAKGVAAALAPATGPGAVALPRPRHSGDAALPDRASAP